jgi:exodeoxyribonuclease VII large subunit
VTALGGAAIHDILTILHQRCPYTRVIIRSTKVQGIGAGAEVAAGIQDLNEHGAVEVIIVGRGGGSREDLSAFNEEIVARAIAASSAPVIAAVGHEIDLSIADLVADRRAPTPTAAAEMVVPRWEDLRAQVEDQAQALQSTLRRFLTEQRGAVEHLRVLGRGYSLTRTWTEGKVVTDAATLAPGDELRVFFAQGEARVRVEDVSV